MLRKLLLAAAVLLSEAASPIGRIGNNSIGDPAQNYQARVPPAFSGIQVTDAGVILNSDQISESGFPITTNITGFSFADRYPAIVGADREAVTSYFLASSGMKYSVIQSANCALVLFAEGPSSVVGISTWNHGLGYVLVAPKGNLAKSGILEILDQTQIGSPCTN